jgi:group II intron reverse transcriptase/maturase
MNINTATKLAFIAKRSIHKPQEKITSLAYLLNEEYLAECYKELKKGKAAGMDNRKLESYSEEEIKQEIAETIQKMKAKKYQPKPVKRIFIEKSNGKLRPLGIPTVIDKIVQQGIKKILEAIYEPHFLNSSYGFRPNRNCHQSLKAVHKMVMTKPINWIIDIDIKGFFDNVNHEWMIECLNQKIADPNFRSIIIKFLKAGIIQEGKYYDTERGTPQGGILSPILANIYLHYVLDLWFENKLKRKIKGYAEIIRYADDFIIGAQTKSEATQILEEIKERLNKFQLEISIEKTKVIEFGRYAEENSRNRGKRKPDTFDFLGFTHYCSKSRKGNFLLKVKTDKKRMKQKTKEMSQWLKTIRNKIKIKDIWKILSAKLRGHYNYYGISSNARSVQAYYCQTTKLTFKWLNRRSQKKSFNWRQFAKYLKLYPLPKPSLAYNMYDIW